jgi:deoxyribodipyrimidine photo-lyase
VALATGSLSLREVVHAVRAQREAGAGPVPLRDLASLEKRLHWHCHFIQKLESEPAMECRALHPLHEASGPDAGAPARFEAWATGATGFPFVDACMKSLIATGWINFRMRAMLMAFASYHLALDWRQSGTRLARLFTDYEPGIHWPQVQMQSGVTGINTPRIYNPVKQSLDQDPQGVFIRRHLPVLAGLPEAFIHEPWRMDEGMQERIGVVIGRDYPAPIVDHEAAARAARERIAAIRRNPQFRALALDVFQRHGSRARRLDDDDPPKRAADRREKTERAARQLTLDL